MGKSKLGKAAPDQRAFPLEEWLYQPDQTQTCTDAFYRFISEYDKIIGLFFFTVGLASRADEIQRIATEALASPKEGEPPKPPRASAVSRVKSYSRLLSRNMVTDMVNNFLCYLSEILQEVVRKRPEVLRSKETLTTHEVLQFGRINDLVAYIADKKVSDLSYGSLGGLREFMTDRLGVEMFQSDHEHMLLTVFIELRNIHTHNRGVVNELFLKRVHTNTYATFEFVKGRPYHVDFDRFVSLSRNAIEVAIHIDTALANKFKLKRTHYKRQLAKERAKERGKLGDALIWG
jgi:hypothetical protein